MGKYLIKDTTLTGIADAIRTKTEKSDTILVSDMATEILSISSGGGLNFSIVGGRTKPTNPAKNMIWVNTETDEIANWIFSATEPVNPVPNMVWISTGTFGNVEFNALKKNGIQVYPRSAKQYVNGAWLDVTAKSWQNGGWADLWNGELYDSGNEYTDITGGFVGVAMPYSTIYATPGNLIIERNSDNLKATQKVNYGGSALVTANKIDLSGFEKLYYIGEFKGIGIAGSSALCVWRELGTYQTDNLVAKLPSTVGTTVVDGSLDISGLPSGKYYIGFHLYHNTSYANITKLWLE